MSGFLMQESMDQKTKNAIAGVLWSQWTKKLGGGDDAGDGGDGGGCRRHRGHGHGRGLNRGRGGRRLGGRSAE